MVKQWCEMTPDELSNAIEDEWKEEQEQARIRDAEAMKEFDEHLDEREEDY